MDHKLLEAYIFLLLLLLLFLPSTTSLSFNLTRFDQNNGPIIFMNNDSFIANSEIQLTRNEAGSSLQGSVGRAYYSQPMQLWNKNTKQITNFTTHFSFKIKNPDNTSSYGDGLSFFLAPVGTSAPYDSAGGYLGLVSPQFYNDTTKNQFVAVEFDSYQNLWDPSADHVGIDINSIVSVASKTWNSSIKNGREANAWITYDSSTQNLSVFLTYVDNPVYSSDSSLYHIIDLSSVLPERVQFGFSAATGIGIETHSILSWDFNSTLPDVNVDDGAPVPTPGIDSSKPIPKVDSSKPNSKFKLIVAVIVGITVLLVALGGVLCIVRWRRKPLVENDAIDFNGEDDDHDFEKGTGPKRFTYHELNRATNNFSEEGKLGEGGFGGVYLGSLGDPSREIAVKRISRGSKQGKKEYVSEVKVISRLRHRNLVQLLGWCHDKGELLLVYEFMPNRSLDYHLYGLENVGLLWKVRYEIARGLASALLYLHEEWEQCVIHRDIKSSNVMLDSAFNAKLGDFGLARLVEHGLGSQTTVLAGTLGYMALECLITGKASKKSDVYSFGVVALEIACGRRPVESREEPNEVRMVEWVWTLYGKHLLLEAVDKRLEGEFDVQQMECLMVVGLWCCHPDYTQRPSIRQVINVLNQDSPLPNLPAQLPVPTYFAPPLNMDMLGFTSSSDFTSSTGTTSSSSQSVLSGTAPLLSQKASV